MRPVHVELVDGASHGIGLGALRRAPESTRDLIDDTQEPLG
jgi:hypothetical protein